MRTRGFIARSSCVEGAARGARYTRSVPKSTADRGYAARLDGLERRRIARWFDVQAPYRRNIRRLEPGFVLDVGCGLGRNLRHLEGNGVGVDHNPDAVEACRARVWRCSRPTSSARRSTRGRALRLVAAGPCH